MKRYVYVLSTGRFYEAEAVFTSRRLALARARRTAKANALNLAQFDHRITRLVLEGSVE